MTDVLVADDDDVIRNALRTLFEDSGYTVYEAADGVAALARVRTHPQPLVVVLDWLMPGLDGLQVIQALDADAPPAHRHAFLLLTAADITHSSHLPPLPLTHYVALMRKPFDIYELLARVAAAAEFITAWNR